MPLSLNWFCLILSVGMALLTLWLFVDMILLTFCSIIFTSGLHVVVDTRMMVKSLVYLTSLMSNWKSLFISGKSFNT